MLQVAESRWDKREDDLRRELVSLESRLHDLESEKAELAASASESTRPLYRRASLAIKPSLKRYHTL